MSHTSEYPAAGQGDQPERTEAIPTGQQQPAPFPPVQWFGAEPASPYAAPSASPYAAPGSSPTTAFGAPVPPADSSPSGSAARPHRRWVDMALSAVVAAVVAAGTTAAVVANDDGATSAVSSTTQTSTSGNPPAGTSAGPVAGAGSSGTAVDWNAVANAVEPSVVAITVTSQGGEAQGSGVVLDTEGRVLTNNHVVSGAQNGELNVTLSDGRTYAARIVGTDPSTDLAVIQMSGATDLKPATLGDSDSVEVGSPVMAVGNPLGLAGTVTTGIVSSLDRPVTTQGEQTSGSTQGAAPESVVTNAIQTDAAVNPGNSGGALVDSSGRVIGIPSSIASLGSSSGGTSGSIGLGFSIPINEAKSIADQLMEDGTAEHPYLGVSLEDGNVKEGAASRNAAMVSTVSENTPAATAGLRADDAVVAVDGEAVNSSESLVAQIRERNVGSKVELTVVRDGRSQQVSVTLTKRPAS
ncbi:MAG TPA: trypsin-like peptidase domain-containing protein [Actinomycetales bacterium]|jgi:putative serine protease PepD